jgi:hypothetical protein
VPAEFTSAFGSTADIAAISAGSTQSRMTQQRHRPWVKISRAGGRPHILLAEMTPGGGLRPTSSHTTKRGGFGSLSRSRPIGSDTADRHRASPRCWLSLARHSRREARRPFAGSKDHQRSTALLHSTHFLFRKGSRLDPLDCTDLGQPFSGHVEKWRLLYLGDRISVRFRLNCSRKFRNRGQRSVAKLLGRRECI